VIVVFRPPFLVLFRAVFLPAGIELLNMEPRSSRNCRTHLTSNPTS